MKIKLSMLAALICTGAVINAAPPQRPDERNDRRPAAPAPARKDDKRPAPGKNDRHPAPKPMPKPMPKPAPVVVHPIVVPPSHPTVVYAPRRNTYTIQLNLHNAILFEQRVVGYNELRDKIRMVSNDRPRPFIIVRVAAGVETARVTNALHLLKSAGFDDVKVEYLNRRVRTAPPVRPVAPRMKRPVR